MKTEGLSSNEAWNTSENLTENTRAEATDLRVGRPLFSRNGDEWVVFDVLGNGRFRAIQEYQLPVQRPDGTTIISVSEALDLIGNDVRYAKYRQSLETFSISETVDKSNHIYKFYEDDVQKFLKKIRPDLILTKDPQGLGWFETKLTPLDAERPIKNIGAVVNPVAIIDILRERARESKTFAEFRQKILADKDLNDTVRSYNLNLHRLFDTRDDKDLSQKTETVRTILETGELPKPSKETEKIKPPGLRTLEVDIQRTTRKLEQSLSQAENVAETGTFQPKEIRPSLARGGTPFPENATSEKRSEER